MVARQRESSGGIQLRDEVGVNGSSRGGIVFAYCAAAVVRYKEVVARQYKRGRSVQPHDEKVGVDRDARGGVVFAQILSPFLADIELPASASKHGPKRDDSEEKYAKGATHRVECVVIMVFMVFPNTACCKREATMRTLIRSWSNRFVAGCFRSRVKAMPVVFYLYGWHG